MRTLVWFRGKDLRLADHLPLLDAIHHAADDGGLVPIFVVDPYFFAPERARELPNRMQFLVESLHELADGIAARGSQLLFAHGKSVDVIPALVRACSAKRVVAHRWSEPVGIERDHRIASALAEQGARLELFEGETLAAPGQVSSAAGEPFAVFTPFARAFAKTVTIDLPKDAPRSIPPLPELSAGAKKLLGARPTLASIGVKKNDQLIAAGEKAARARLTHFSKGAALHYDDGRNIMGVTGTSRLSQDLKFGTLSARTVWHATHDALAKRPKARSTFANELVWREFSYDVLRARPSVLERPFRATWEGFPFRRDEEGWRAWVNGETGYPVVDAAAKQLLAEGFVHNRARMIAASFLCKHLLVDFRRGEAHYMKFLTDGDWAANDLGWQWSAGCGVDAQPWFRVFNPVLQGTRFDDDGAYVRHWLPALARMPKRFLHEPWNAPAAELAEAGVVLGRTYPKPIVEHAAARARFLSVAKAHLG